MALELDNQPVAATWYESCPASFSAPNNTWDLGSTAFVARLFDEVECAASFGRIPSESLKKKKLIFLGGWLEFDHQEYFC